MKQRLELQVLDIQRETEVILNWRSFAALHNLPIDAVMDIANTILKLSRYVQTKLVNTTEICIDSISIVGYGGMAKLLAKTFANEKYRVIITGRDYKKAQKISKEIGVEFNDIEKALHESNVVIIALPPEAFKDGYVETIASLLKDKLVMDILSAKAKLFKYIEDLSEEYSFRYISTHPLFGSYTPPYGEKVVLIPSKTGFNSIKFAECLWRSIGVEPVIATLEEHEKAMALVQVLTHFILIAYRDFVEQKASEFKIDLNKFATATFRDVQSVIYRLKKIENVVKEIGEENIYSQHIKNDFLNHLMVYMKKYSR